MTTPKASPLATARQRVFDIYVDLAFPMSTSVLEKAKHEATAAEQRAVQDYGWQHLFGEVERQRNRKTGLRRGERTVSGAGDRGSLPLLGMTIPQARENNASKRAHAESALAVVEFEREVIDIAEERMVERGLDPLTTEMVIGAFIDDDEIVALRKTA